MGLVFVRAFDIFRNRDWIVGQAVVVDAAAVRVSDLFVAGTVAFDRAFVDVGIALLLVGHHRHRGLPYFSCPCSCRREIDQLAVCHNRPMPERTLAIIKPDAVSRQLAGRILQRIEDAGFQIRAMRRVALTRPQAAGFYAVHRERPFFASLTDFMSSGPALVMVLEAPDAIKKWRTLMGATDPAKADAGTIRREFAQSIERNATHGSDAPETAAFEIGYFFAAMDLI